MSKLVIWSVRQGDWLPYPDDEIVWLDRTLLSEGRDLSLHRSPRCPGLRFVQHRWELFSRDPTHLVYAAPFKPGATLGQQDVVAAASHVLPTATGGLESQPVRLDAGGWVIAVGTWVLPLCIDVSPQERRNLSAPRGDDLPTTYDAGHAELAAELGRPADPNAVASVARYFARNPTACLAMAYYYRSYLTGEQAPQAVPMHDVVIALNLTNEGAVSEYKKELQRRIWNEQGHQRELARFLLANGLIRHSDLARALKIAADNEASGRASQARERLKYKTRKAT
jgi:hypothetical protein